MPLAPDWAALCDPRRSVARLTRIRSGMIGEFTMSSKFSKMFALASKATNRMVTLSRRESEGSVSVRVEGFPQSLTADAVEALAQDKGGRVLVTANIGSAIGKATGVLGGNAAAALVAEMTTDDDSPAAGRVSRPAARKATPSANGTPELTTAAA